MAGMVIFMNREAARKIIKAEQLISYNFLENRANHSDEVVIQKKAGQWVVYATNERASKVSSGERVFDNESDALEHFIRRLRALNAYRNSK